MQRLPIIYVRGYAGGTAGIDTQVDDPFYGFNKGATHVRVDGDGDPAFYQFEGPLLRLMTDENYQLLVRGDQHRYLGAAADGSVPAASLWVYRFYDQAATTFAAPAHEGLIDRVRSKWHRRVTADGFDIEVAAQGLYDLVQLVRLKTGARKVFLVAHSMGGLVCRSMIQKVCAEDGREAARDIVARLFTYATPHGGITFRSGVLDWLEEVVGPAGADIFAPDKMYGYLTPNKTFGDVPGRGDAWDPQHVEDSVFPHSDTFCLIGTNPQDYGRARTVVGVQSDGLVRIDHAYVRGAHRAFVHRSHSGPYGEVNSEEGYQNLRRFLFGRWQVDLTLDGLPTYPQNMADLPADEQWPVWQADLRIGIRGLPIVLSEQLAAHWCPIQLNEEMARHLDSPDSPVPLAGVFLLDPQHEAELARERQEAPGPAGHGGRMRYTLSLRIFKLVVHDGSFSFRNHLEQVPDWADSLIVDVGPDEAGTGLSAWAAWNSQVVGANDRYDPITDGLPNAPSASLVFQRQGDAHTCAVPMPATAAALPVLGASAQLTIRVTDRLPAGPAPDPVPAV